MQKCLNRSASTPSLARGLLHSRTPLLVRCQAARDPQATRAGRPQGDVSAAAVAGVQLEVRTTTVQSKPVRTTGASDQNSAPLQTRQQTTHTEAVISTQPNTSLQEVIGVGASTSENAPTPLPPKTILRAEDAWQEFEARFEADLQTVAITLVAIVGVICFWRGIWSLLDYYLGENPIGDISCILVGFGIIMYIRLSGLKVGSFWPSG